MLQDLNLNLNKKEPNFVVIAKYFINLQDFSLLKKNVVEHKLIICICLTLRSTYKETKLSILSMFVEFICLLSVFVKMIIKI